MVGRKGNILLKSKNFHLADASIISNQTTFVSKNFLYIKKLAENHVTQEVSSILDGPVV